MTTAVPATVRSRARRERDENDHAQTLRWDSGVDLLRGSIHMVQTAQVPGGQVRLGYVLDIEPRLEFERIMGCFTYMSPHSRSLAWALAHAPPSGLCQDGYNAPLESYWRNTLHRVLGYAVQLALYRIAAPYHFYRVLRALAVRDKDHSLSSCERYGEAYNVQFDSNHLLTAQGGATALLELAATAYEVAQCRDAPFDYSEIKAGTPGYRAIMHAAELSIWHVTSAVRALSREVTIHDS